MHIRLSQSRGDYLRKHLKRKQREQRSRERRTLTVERLEDRRLLAGPELFAIRPDQSPLLQDGDVLDTAPREFNLLFKGAANIDDKTIAGGVSLVRSGSDGTFSDGNEVTVPIGFAGLNDVNNPVHIILRPASSLPDDTYRLEITTALKDKAGNSFVPPGGQTSFTRDFDLDLGRRSCPSSPSRSAAP